MSGYTTRLPAVELGSIPLWRFGHVLNDQTCHEATRHFKFAGLYGILNLVLNVVTKVFSYYVIN